MIDLGCLPNGKFMYAEADYHADFYTARKTPVYDIREKNTGGRLGWLKWYPSWRGFCFFPTVNTVFDAGCLQQIGEWIAELDKRYKQLKEAKPNG